MRVPLLLSHSLQRRPIRTSHSDFASSVKSTSLSVTSFAPSRTVVRRRVAGRSSSVAVSVSTSVVGGVVVCGGQGEGRGGEFGLAAFAEGGGGFGRTVQHGNAGDAHVSGLGAIVEVGYADQGHFVAAIVDPVSREDEPFSA